MNRFTLTAVVLLLIGSRAAAVSIQPIAPTVHPMNAEHGTLLSLNSGQRRSLPQTFHYPSVYVWPARRSIATSAAACMLNACVKISDNAVFIEGVLS